MRAGLCLALLAGLSACSDLPGYDAPNTIVPTPEGADDTIATLFEICNLALSDPSKAAVLAAEKGWNPDLEESMRGVPFGTVNYAFTPPRDSSVETLKIMEMETPRHRMRYCQAALGKTGLSPEAFMSMEGFKTDLVQADEDYSFQAEAERGPNVVVNVNGFGDFASIYIGRGDIKR